MTSGGEHLPQLFAGTSGFAYPQWKPDFYPPELASTKFLEFYSQRLNSVEINYTYRRIAAPTTFEKWVQATQQGFLFCTKAHMRITHMLRLKNAAEFTEVFLKSLEPLRATRRLGPILFQLPPRFPADTALLADFLAPLPGDLRYTFEFRDKSWLADPVYQLLEKHRVALCLAESEKLEVPEVITSDFVYCRLRKPEYTADDRKQIAERAQRLLSDQKDVFVFFKHEDTPAGAVYAEELLKAGTA